MTRHLSAMAWLNVVTLMDINSQLAQGRPFFIDIVRQGVLLYEVPGFPLAEPKPLTPAAAAVDARRAFDYWYPSADHFKRLAALAIRLRLSDEGAFLMHQAVERLYHCALNVITLHSPKSHRLALLRSHAERVAPGLASAWPREARFDKRCFSKLDRAYVDARYSPTYEITGDEVVWLKQRIHLLQQMVAGLCQERLGALPAIELCRAMEPRTDHSAGLDRQARRA